MIDSGSKSRVRVWSRYQKSWVFPTGFRDSVIKIHIGLGYNSLGSGHVWVVKMSGFSYKFWVWVPTTNEERYNGNRSTKASDGFG